MKSISIITVCFNSEKTILKTIESVLNQNFTNFEYIIIDGKSSDSTLKIITSFEQKFLERGIAYKFISEQDKGIYDAMNKGIKLSNGNLIGLLNSDDWYELGTLQIVNNEFLKSNLDFVHGNMRLYSKEKKVIKELKPKGKEVVNRKMPFFHPTSFARKKVYEELGLYSLNYKICSDYDFMIRVIKNNFKIVYVDKVLTNFTEGGISTTNVKGALLESHVIRVNNGYHKLISKFYYYVETIICKIKYS